MQTSPNFDVEEVFLKGKHTPATNEDGIIVTPYLQQSLMELRQNRNWRLMEKNGAYSDGTGH